MPNFKIKYGQIETSVNCDTNDYTPGPLSTVDRTQPNTHICPENTSMHNNNPCIYVKHSEQCKNMLSYHILNDDDVTTLVNTINIPLGRGIKNIQLAQLTNKLTTLSTSRHITCQDILSMFIIGMSLEDFWLLLLNVIKDTKLESFQRSSYHDECVCIGDKGLSDRLYYLEQLLLAYESLQQRLFQCITMAQYFVIPATITNTAVSIFNMASVYILFRCNQNSQVYKETFKNVKTKIKSMMNDILSTNHIISINFHGSLIGDPILQATFEDLYIIEPFKSIIIQDVCRILRQSITNNKVDLFTSCIHINPTTNKVYDVKFNMLQLSTKIASITNIQVDSIYLLSFIENDKELAYIAYEACFNHVKATNFDYMKQLCSTVNTLNLKDQTKDNIYKYCNQIHLPTVEVVTKSFSSLFKKLTLYMPINIINRSLSNMINKNDNIFKDKHYVPKHDMVADIKELKEDALEAFLLHYMISV